MKSLYQPRPPLAPAQPCPASSVTSRAVSRGPGAIGIPEFPRRALWRSVFARAAADLLRARGGSAGRAGPGRSRPPARSAGPAPPPAPSPAGAAGAPLSGGACAAAEPPLPGAAPVPPARGGAAAARVGPGGGGAVRARGAPRSHGVHPGACGAEGPG